MLYLQKNGPRDRKIMKKKNNLFFNLTYLKRIFEAGTFFLYEISHHIITLSFFFFFFNSPLFLGVPHMSQNGPQVHTAQQNLFSSSLLLVYSFIVLFSSPIPSFWQKLLSESRIPSGLRQQRQEGMREYVCCRFIAHLLLIMIIFKR